MKILFFLATAVALSSIAQCDSSIDMQIDKIMQAPTGERYELMNQLKAKIAAMNENERNDALQKLSGGMGMRNGMMRQNSPSSMPMQQIQPNYQNQRLVNTLNQPNSPTRR
jgi:hypothetical protein